MLKKKKGKKPWKQFAWRAQEDCVIVWLEKSSQQLSLLVTLELGKYCTMTYIPGKLESGQKF